MNFIIPTERIERQIYLIRGQKVMLDSDLAQMYGVTTKKLNQAMRRNIARFPEDFMFRLSAREADLLRSQIVTSKKGRGGRRYLPFVFTEHGTVMLASALNSPVAIQASILIVRAFVRLREILSSHREFARRLDELEQRVEIHGGSILAMLEKFRRLTAQLEKPPRRIGFQP